MKIYRFISLYMVLGMMFASCSDWLDVRPETEKKEKDQFSAYKGFRSALTGCYMAMGHQNAYGEKLTMSHVESLAGLWDIEREPYESDRKVDYFLLDHDYNDVACGALQGMYSKLYNIIVQANKIIAHAEADAGVFPDEATHSVILGEAYAIRAYCHLDILRLFGEVPGGEGQKVSLPYSEVTAFDERAVRYDFAGYTEKLLADLNRAEQLLKDNDPIFRFTFGELNAPDNIDMDDTYMAYRQSRLNYWAVKALQARAHLYTGNRKEAYAAAKAVIGAQDSEGNPVMELSGGDDRQSGMYACPNECLFYLSKHNVKTTASFLVGGKNKSDYRYDLCIPRDYLDDDLFPENKGSDSRYTGWNKSVDDGETAAIKKYYFDDEKKDLALYYQIIPMLRMSEMYLIAIETTEDVEEANSLYADYLLEGCNVALEEDVFSASSNRTEVLLPEYRREFFAEGQMFYAYKRTGASEMLWCYDEITDEDYVLWNCVNKNFNP